MRNVLLKAAAGFVAGVVGIYTFGCDDATGPGTEFGQAELIYELESDHLKLTLVDAIGDSEFYLLRGYNETTDETGLWYVEPPAKEPILIASSEYSQTSGWWANAKISPDKKNVVFQEKSGIYVIPLSGGDPRVIYGQGLDPTPAQWIDDETILIYSENQIKTVNVYTLEVATVLAIEYGIRAASLSSDGSRLFVNGEYQEGDEFSPWRYFFRIYDTATWEYNGYVLGEDGIDHFPDGPWSPDGTKLAIFTGPGTHIGYFDTNTEDDVMVFRSDKLVLEWIFGLMWTPDSKKVLASEERDDNILRVFAVDVE
jgi:WD40 repeat protein